MSQQFHRASTGDTVTVPDVLAPKYEANPAWAPGPGSAAVDDGSNVLKGQALDGALEHAGLAKTGSAAEERDRLAKHAEENS